MRLGLLMHAEKITYSLITVILNLNANDNFALAANNQHDQAKPIVKNLIVFIVFILI